MEKRPSRTEFSRQPGRPYKAIVAQVVHKFISSSSTSHKAHFKNWRACSVILRLHLHILRLHLHILLLKGGTTLPTVHATIAERFFAAPVRAR